MNALSSVPTAPGVAPIAGAVLAKAFGRVVDQLGLTNAAESTIIGLSESTVSRLRANGRPLDPQSKGGELALLLIRVFRSLDALVGNDRQKRLAWLSSHNRGLNGAPDQLIMTAEGLCAVVAYLDGMRATL